MALAGRLIAIPTVNPPGRCYHECAEVLVDALRSLRIDARMLHPATVDTAGPVVLAEAGEGRTLYLHGHYDVVPAFSEDQFQPVVDGGRLRGRGAADMKGAIASMAHALAAHREYGARGRLVLVFTVERRINPDEDLETERQRLLDTIDGVQPLDAPVSVEFLQEAAPSGRRRSPRFEETLASAVELVTGARPPIVACPGLLETRFYEAAGIAALAYGPGSLAEAHGPNESVAIEELVHCAAVYALAARHLATDPRPPDN